MFLAEIFRSSGINFPATSLASNRLPQNSRWLQKPLKSAGGMGIYFADSHVGQGIESKFYFQEYIEGIACSAVYVGYEDDALLLGVTRQLVGETWLHAAPFHYCGSIGPLNLAPAINGDLKRIGTVLHHQCHLRGLFGVDFVLADGLPWPVEINPRYPASVEVLEFGLGIQAMAWHCAAYDFDTSLKRKRGLAACQTPDPISSLTLRTGLRPLENMMIGKAILFADHPLQFTREGPWLRSLTHPTRIDEMPVFADISTPGLAIEAGRPILTIFSRSKSVEGCIDNLKQIARDLDQCLAKK
jgi:predicted ATP-grasp superfamily ATP-dependent carboligase